ncbi:MAG: VOC family protein [Planctomycetota bacterium]
MKLGHVELEAADPLASMNFFVETLGYSLVANQGDRFIWVEKDGVEFLLRPKGDYVLPCLVYYTDHPEAEAERLRAAGMTVEKRGTCFHFEDAAGNSFQVVNPNEDHSG